ncbi:ATP-dependent DNA helicase PIF1 [Metarhizium brunneum]
MATSSSLPSLYCTKYRKDFPETPAYFKVFKKGGFTARYVDYTATKSAAKKETRGQKRRVLGDTDLNMQQKAPRLTPKVPAQ